MRLNRCRDIWLILLSASFFLSSYAPPKTWQVSDQSLTRGWKLVSSAALSVTGAEISRDGFDASGWYDARVPGTVLGSLVADSVYRNVFYHRNLTLIPDSLFNVPWWYRKSFPAEAPRDGQHYRLKLNGISYRADIWVNGHQVASHDTLAGSFRRFTVDVTPFVVTGKNVIALKIFRAQKQDLTIGFVDWNPEPADHNMGIWRDIHLVRSGPLTIETPFVTTKVDTATLDHADLTISAVVSNHQDKPVTGILRARVGSDISLEKSVHLAGGESREIVFSPEQYPALGMDHPRLWWTHELGTPNLYTLDLSFSEGGAVSDRRELRFGIRSVSGYITPEGFRGYRLNGKKILIKGGGWTDPMLLNASPAYEEAGVDYAVHMHLNALRMEGFWGKDQHIYDLCDEKGILIMVGFSCQWEWGHFLGLPDDQHGPMRSPEMMQLATDYWRDQLLWLRNHPSIFLWLYGSDKWPRPALERKYLDILHEVDTTRPYVQSAKEHTSAITGATGMKMRGPYDYVPPDYWYLDTAYGGAFGFNTETSPGPEIPVEESLRKMIPADSLWPIGSAWLYHAARGKFHNLSAYNNAMDQRLGKATGLTDYLRKAQFLNYEGMRAMYEAFEANRFRATGIIQWMYNASWPKLWWQLYDYYLMPTGAFYGARKALEPVHIAYHYGEHSVEVFNNTLRGQEGLSAEVTVLDFSMKKMLEKKIPLPKLASLATDSVFTLPEMTGLSRTWFLDLRLKDAEGKTVSTNFYVLSTDKDELDEKASTWYITPQSHYADLRLLNGLRNVSLGRTTRVAHSGDTTRVTVRLSNPSASIAFMVHLDLRKSATHASVTPVFWQQNYFTLLPGESRTVSGYCRTKDLKGSAPLVTVEGWNISPDAAPSRTR
jgi:exo-1,4-beta-D-glucosaminidase